ncbi:MAG: hypothetical protein H3C30_05460 [Candidatus Hydrogenedentes bacterium]|nr:hypothetical protein [Candidatus Hydrogenedentota bacterium]
MAARRRTPVFVRILTLLSICFYQVTRILPLAGARALGKNLAWAAYLLIPRIRRIGMANLDLAYGGELTHAEKKAILQESVRNLGLVAAEFSRLRLLDSEGKGRWYDVRGLEHIDRTRGGILMSAHLGNWEWLAPGAAAHGLKNIIVVRGFDDPWMDIAVDAVRRVKNVETVHKGRSVPALMRAIGEHRFAGILADQSPRENAVPAVFFGKPVWATVGPVLLARRTNSPIYPVCMARDSKGKYTLEFFPAIELRDSGDKLADMSENSQRCQSAIEVMVRKHPGQWLWFHRRWRSRERLEREWSERVGKGTT